MNFLPVYDVVLLPPSVINERSLLLSKQLSNATSTAFTLKKDELYPHLSLYMLNLTPENVEMAKSRLRELANSLQAVLLEAKEYGTSPEGMFEVFYQKTPAIISLQEQTIEALNPLRSGLRMKDPVGRVLREYIQTAPQEAKENLEQFGYDEIGSFFKPHITFTRFIFWDSIVQNLPPPTDFSATFSTLALCKMGEHGTCTQIIEQWTLGGPNG